MVKQKLIALDQLFNTFIGDDGYADETLRAHVAIDWLFKTFFGEVNHCYQSYLSEWRRAQLPKKYQQCRTYAAFF